MLHAFVVDKCFVFFHAFYFMFSFSFLIVHWREIKKERPRKDGKSSNLLSEDVKRSLSAIDPEVNLYCVDFVLSCSRHCIIGLIPISMEGWVIKTCLDIYLSSLVDQLILNRFCSNRVISNVFGIKWDGCQSGGGGSLVQPTIKPVRPLVKINI